MSDSVEINIDQFDYDMVLISLPMSDLVSLPTAPAVLKGIAESHEFKLKTHDFNIDVFKVICKSNHDHFLKFQNYFLTAGPHSSELTDQVSQFYNYVIDFLSKYRARYIGISVFSVYTHIATFELCSLIKKRRPDWKIVLGGKGLTTTPYVSIYNQTTSAEKIMQFHSIMIKRKLAYHTIIGDAEDALVEFLNDQTQFPDQMNRAGNETLVYPFSNFDDYDFDGYIGIQSRVQLPIISSKGCVRSCDFCDVATQNSKFQSKDGKRLAEEIIYLNNKYNFQEFDLADSIANGNMKSLKACLEILAEHNQFLSDDKKIEINGNWIARPPNGIKPEFFDLMFRAGFKSVTIGAEHGSDYVLEAMDKKTNVAGLFYELEHMKRVGIKSLVNNIIGHWSERYQDFLDHIDMILKLGPYVADRTVTALHLGPGFSILHGTPVDQQREKNKLITSNDNFSFLWYTPLNPNLTMKTRLSRWAIMHEISHNLNFPLYSVNYFASLVRERLRESFDQSRQFINKHVDPDTYSVCPSVSLIDNWQPYVKNRVQQLFSDTTLKLVVESNHCSGAPRLFVRYNGKTLYYNELAQGCSIVEIVIKYDFENKLLLEIGMDNKNVNDTKIDSDGQIVADKNILLKQIEIDGIDIVKNTKYFFHELEHMEGDTKLPIGRPGFFSNSQINIEFYAPFWQWYIKNCSQNANDWHPYNSNSQTQYLIDEVKSYINRYEY